ncbi:hypothetical protein CR513_02433, partial [Mucuna pruriens]
MKVVVNDLEQQHEELRGHVNQLKEQMGRILEILQNPELRKGIGGNTFEAPQVTLEHPLGFTPSQPHGQVQFPSYSLPHNYTPPTTIEENQHVLNVNKQCEEVIPPKPVQNLVQNPGPVVGNMPAPHITSMGAHEERLKVIEGAKRYGFEATDLYLVPDVIIPHKFKVLDFDKYRGNSCPKNHLISYCRKMASHAPDNKLVIHFFQENPVGVASDWYLNLEKGQIRTWKDLAKAFLKQYKCNDDMAPDQTQL